jgi:hypothetical protein
MITSFKPDIFKQLPGINTAQFSAGNPTNKDNIISETFPFIMNSGFLSTATTQGLRMVHKSFTNEILDQKSAYQDNQLLWPSLYTFEKILNA